MNRRELGAKYEVAASEWLEEHGYHVVERNFRCRFGEVDLIATDGIYLVFIEVKYRKNDRKGLPEEAVDVRKQRTICKVADYYRMSHFEFEDRQIRFDVVAILDHNIKVYKNAFEYRWR